ncbi:ATP-binding protein [Faecalicatena sp. AGMB00832]|uniref:ATP-binding protein n=1 Tax=Faecalicatena faecalis TaxID=2726362 RepID=A0ABS6D1H9_9FIRM|nr:ATP-binding protein [Faecalicatena faecalis]MBU3875458.1 ATP-binding protein [Faecalicatena faecalis]
MNTTELFNFHFVDRDIERVKLNKFLSDSTATTLWIKGNRGFGKTKFFDYVIKKHNEYRLCYIDIKLNKSSIDIVSEFIIELQKYSDIDFISSVKRKYKQFYNSTYKKTKNITNELFPEVSNMVSLILDLGYYAVTYSDENINSVDLISDYIRGIIDQNRLCICIDNFSRCDTEIAKLFFRIFKQFLNNKNFKSCIITTSEDLSIELMEEIYHNLPYTDIEVKQFLEVDYFYQIMNPIFEMEYFTKDDLIYIYNKCGGSPKRLATLISKLLEKNAINVYSYKKAIINKRIMIQLLQTDHIRFDDSDFKPEQKWILFSYLCLKESVPISELMNLALYISKRCFLFQAYNENLFTQILLHLVDDRILNYDARNMVSTCHDSDYIELLDIFYDSQLKGLFSQYAYEFLMQNPGVNYHNELLCKNAREANTSGWEQLNFRYGKKLFHNKQIYEAQKILSFLEDHLHKFKPVQILFIALVSYETGNYKLSIKQFNLIDPKVLRFNKVKYYYYFYLGKCYNNIGQTSDAIPLLDKALNEVPKDSDVYVQTLNVLHMFCFEVPSQLKRSEDIFKEIKNSYKDTHPKVWANTMRGCQNFLDDESSLNVLDEAELKLEDELDKAFLKTTKGFVLVKLNRLRDAVVQFEESYNVIKRLKIHEFSYAANNLAVCYMIQRNYKRASEILLEALFWNRTTYGCLVIQTHLMICSLYLSQKNEVQYYYNYLKNYMDNHNIVDPIMNRKIYMNLAITSHGIDNLITEKVYFEKAYPFVKNSSSEWRFYKLCPEMADSKILPPTCEYMNVIEFDPWFLIYAHD